jgi:uncharacterized coiled-coil protein SlyX
MDVPSCNGCHQRDAVIASLEARLAKLEAEATIQQQNLRRLEATVHRLTERLAQYEPEVRHEHHGRGPDPALPSASYSVDAETKRRLQRKRRRKKSPGRQPTELKFANAERTEDIYPKRVRRSDCQLVRQRAVWRLENGRACLVGYCIFAGPGGQEPPIPGVTRRCEYGIEILVVLAFLVYCIGISLDKACAVLGFFCQLPLSKSQADALLRQLAQHGQGELDLRCALIAHAAVVAMDETGWHVGIAASEFAALQSRDGAGRSRSLDASGHPFVCPAVASHDTDRARRGTEHELAAVDVWCPPCLRRWTRYRPVAANAAAGSRCAKTESKTATMDAYLYKHPLNS